MAPSRRLQARTPRRLSARSRQAIQIAACRCRRLLWRLPVGPVVVAVDAPDRTGALVFRRRAAPSGRVAPVAGAGSLALPRLGGRRSGLSTVTPSSWAKWRVSIPTPSPTTFTHDLHHKYFEVNCGEGLVPIDKWLGTWHDGSEAGATARLIRDAQDMVGESLLWDDRGVDWSGSTSSANVSMRLIQ